MIKYFFNIIIDFVKIVKESDIHRKLLIKKKIYLISLNFKKLQMIKKYKQQLIFDSNTNINQLFMPHLCNLNFFNRLSKLQYIHS